MSLRRKSSRGKHVTRWINAGELRDIQLEDPDIYDREDWQERVNAIREAVDEISTDLHSLLEERENKNIRNAYGSIQRCLAYLDDEI